MSNPTVTTMGRMNEERRGVYPFCAPCTGSSIAGRAPEVAGPAWIGTRFHGHRDVCADCGRGYVGRKVLQVARRSLNDADVPTNK